VGLARELPVRQEYFFDGCKAMDVKPLPSSSASRWQQLHIREIALASITVLMIVAGFALLIALRNVFVSIFLGILIATALRPAAVWLRSRHLPPMLAASIPVMLLLISVVGFLVLIFPFLSLQFQALFDALPNLYSQLRDSLQTSSLRIVRQIGSLLPASLIPEGATTPGSLVPQVLSWIPSIGNSLFVLISTVLFTYYWLMYRDRSIRGLLLLIDPDYRTGIEGIWLQIEERIGAFMRGQLLLALATAVLSLIGYWITGVPYPLLLAIIAGILEFVPYLGALLTAVFAGVLGFSVSPTLGLIALGVGILVQQIENLALVPRIMEKAVGVSPLFTLLAFVGFTGLFGPIGGFLAIPLAAGLQVLFVAWMERRTAISLPDEDRSMSNRLLYQVQELTQDITSHLRIKEDATPDVADEAEDQLEEILLDLQKQLQEGKQLV
jgi:predicted PurR-regulated permease PerM